MKNFIKNWFHIILFAFSVFVGTFFCIFIKKHFQINLNDITLYNYVFKEKHVLMTFSIIIAIFIHNFIRLILLISTLFIFILQILFFPKFLTNEDREKIAKWL